MLVSAQEGKQPNEKPNKGGDKSVEAKVKDVRQLGCVFQVTEPPESLSFLQKGTQVWTNSTSTIHKSYEVSC